jgi:hypothetical protein
MITAQPVTVEQYSRSTFETDAEYVEGKNRISQRAFESAQQNAGLSRPHAVFFR